MPRCSHTKIYRNGKHQLSEDKKKQRYLCTNCMYPFIAPSLATSTLKSQKNTSENNQISVQEGMKNLEPQPYKTKVVDETLQDNNKNNNASDSNLKNMLLEFSWWMKKEGYKEDTIKGKTKLIQIMCNRGANLYDPDSIKAVIAQQQAWSEGRKENAVNAYSTFLRMIDGTWNPPIYTRIRKIPFIPTEKELTT